MIPERRTGLGLAIMRHPTSKSRQPGDWVLGCWDAGVGHCFGETTESQLSWPCSEAQTDLLSWLASVQDFMKTKGF